MEQFKVLLAREGDSKPVQLFCNTRSNALNEAKELSSRNSGKQVSIFQIVEVLLETVSSSTLDEGVGIENHTKEKVKK